MKQFFAGALTLLVSGMPQLHATQSPQVDRHWTGGFWRAGNWVAVNLRLGGSSGNTADILFPSYGGRENVINVPLDNLKQFRGSIHFEVPAGAGKVIFDGREKNGTISGTFAHGNTRGTFGLTRWAYVTVDALEPYYGAYRVSPDRVISILRGWGQPRTLNYVDYQTGQVGTLWPSSQSEFYSGEGLSVSYPVALRVSFERDAAGNVASLTWQTANATKVVARKIEFREGHVAFRHGDVTLAGTLLLPALSGRHPVVIVTPGDYGTHRNQLRLWAHNYVSQGMGALIFDARGGGESMGAVNSSSFSDLANDVVAAVHALKARADVDPDRIGLFGFSNSAWTVTLAASRAPEVAFLILQSLVGVQPWKQDIYRAETQLRVDGFPEDIVKQGTDFVKLKFEVARTGEGWERLQEIAQGSAAERWLGYTNLSNSFERLRHVYETTMTYDPVPALEKLRMPILAIWGDQDTYLPVRESIEVFERAMARAGNQSYVVKVYPRSDHSLLVNESGSPSTGGKERNFAAGLWKMQTDWWRQYVGLPH